MTMTTSRRRRRAEVWKCILLTALSAIAWTLIVFTLPSYIHSRHCSGCEWFWCASYTGGGDL